MTCLDWPRPRPRRWTGHGSHGVRGDAVYGQVESLTAAAPGRAGESAAVHPDLPRRARLVLDGGVRPERGLVRGADAVAAGPAALAALGGRGRRARPGGGPRGGRGRVAGAVARRRRPGPGQAVRPP